MKKLMFPTLALSFLALMFFAAPAKSADIAIDIDIAPSTLNLAYQGEVVTIHTDIAYGIVVGASVTLNDIPIAWWKSDDRGNFVAKFNSADVKDAVVKGENVLKLSGTTVYGDSFSGTGVIRVISVTGKK